MNPDLRARVRRLMLMGALVCPRTPRSIDVVTWDDSGICTPEAAVTANAAELGFLLHLEAGCGDVNPEHVQRVSDSLGNTVPAASIAALLWYMEGVLTNSATVGYGPDKLPLMRSAYSMRYSGHTGFYDKMTASVSAARILLEYRQNDAFVIGWQRMLPSGMLAHDLLLMHLVRVVDMDLVKSSIVKWLQEWNPANISSSPDYMLQGYPAFRALSIMGTIAGEPEHPRLHYPERLGNVDDWYNALSDTTVPCACHRRGTNGYSLNWFIDQMRHWWPVEDIVNKMRQDGYTEWIS